MSNFRYELSEPHEITPGQWHVSVIYYEGDRIAGATESIEEPDRNEALRKAEKLAIEGLQSRVEFRKNNPV